MTVSSYQFNHPKNYIGYVIALGLAGDRDQADERCEEYVTGGADMARRGAQNMGLIESERDGRQYTYELTDRGEWFYASAPRYFGVDDQEAVLELFDELRGAQKRFVDEFPEFGEIAPDVIRGDPAVDTLVDYMNEIHRDQLEDPQIGYGIRTPDLFWELWLRDAHFAAELLLRDHEYRDTITGDTFDDIEPGEGLEIEDIGQVESIEYGYAPYNDHLAIYRSPTTYQLKNLLWHMGVLQSKGRQANWLADPDNDPGELTWALEREMLDRESAYVPADQTSSDGGVVHG